MCSASSTSRAMMPGLGDAGQPGSPSRPDTSPSWQQAPGPASARVLRVLRDDAVEGASRTPAPGASPASRATQRPSSENTRTPARDRRHQAELGELVAVEALGDRADRPHVDQARPLAEVVDVLGGLGGVGDRGRCWPWRAPRCSRRRAAAAEPEATVSASSRPGSRRWVCRSTRPGSASEPVGVDAVRRRQGRRRCRPRRARRRGRRGRRARCRRRRHGGSGEDQAWSCDCSSSDPSRW